jgi:hypothetical protein
VHPLVKKEDFDNVKMHGTTIKKKERENVFLRYKNIYWKAFRRPNNVQRAA